MANEWVQPEYAEAYLSQLHEIPHRREAEETLLSELPARIERVLDLGCGDGHLLSLVLDRYPTASGVGLDLSPTMLTLARQRFSNRASVMIDGHDLDHPLPDLGSFDCVVSSFAIHHCEDDRKRNLYSEVVDLLNEGGIFCNLEHVSSPSQRVHERFLAELGITVEQEDPSNRLLDVETQLAWFRELGLEDVDCYWKWRELALLIGRKPTR